MDRTADAYQTEKKSIEGKRFEVSWT